MIVGMFDGNSFKKIKRAKIGGVPYRDKLTAVWFELLDLAGKSNHDGLLVDNNEIPYKTYEDIAIMIDRDEKEVELCMNFFINEQMVKIVNKVYCITKFVEYQNAEGLQRIREQGRQRVAQYRERKKLALIEENTECNAQCNAECNVTGNAHKNKKEKEKENKNNKENIVDDFTSACACEDFDGEAFSDDLKFFCDKYGITIDDYNCHLSELKFDKLDKAYAASQWLRDNFTVLSKVCKHYEKIIAGTYADEVKGTQEAIKTNDYEDVYKRYPKLRELGG